ncbi:MAG: thiamine pyrophosphate-binding protein [Steroidobacteraceae bacterium]
MKDETEGSAESSGTEPEPATASRRVFLGAATLAMAGVGGAVKTRTAAATPDDPPIKVQELFTQSLNAEPRRADFSGPRGISGAQVFANLCADEKLAAMFMAPGNYTITHEIAQVGIPSYGGRSEGSMCAAADGFTRASGEVAACSGTEGPGFAHMIMYMGSAHFANTPLLCLASNRTLASEDSNKSIQFLYQQNLSQGLRKYGKRITAPERIYEYGSYAFRNLKSGVPGLVHLDFPAEVAEARFTDPAKLVNRFEASRYRTDSRAAAHPAEVRKAVEMIAKAERPVIVAGYGVMWRRAWEPLWRAAERNDIPMVGAGPVRGAVPDDHRLSANMANEALLSADLVVVIGQYLMPSVGDWTFEPGVPTIRVHPEAEDIGRNWPVDLGIVSDEQYFLEALADALPRRKRDSWVAEVRAATAKRVAYLDGIYKSGLDHSQATNTIHPSVLCQEVHNFLYKGRIDPRQTVTGYDGMATGFYAGQWLRAFRPAQEIVPLYQFGAMGPAMAMMLGASVAVQRGVGNQASHSGAPVFVLTGDACANYSLFEIDTAQKYRIPIITLVYNNDCWGSFGTAAATPRATHLHLFQEKVRYDKMAEALGARGAYVHTPEQLRAALQAAYDEAVRDKTSTVINCQGLRDFSIASKFPNTLGFSPEPGVGALMH